MAIVSSYIFESTINGDVIIACIDKLCENLDKKTVLVMDNASIRRRAEIRVKLDIDVKVS